MTKPHTQTCAMADFLNVFGDAWTLLIVREALYGTTRFSDFQRNTGAAKNLLSDRLSMLLEVGILEKVEVGTYGKRFAYQITPKGESLRTVIASIVLWCNDNLYAPGQEVNLLVSRQTGDLIRSLQPSDQPATSDTWNDLGVVAGPGASRAAKARLGQTS